MVPALIILGVIVFLAVDGYILYRVFAARRSADDYGVTPVPGDLSIALTPGRLKISYQEAYKAPGDEDHIYFEVPSALEVSVVAPTGESLEIKGPGFHGMGSVKDTGKNWSRARVGTVEITQPGQYTVSARGTLEGAVEPVVLVGR